MAVPRAVGPRIVIKVDPRDGVLDSAQEFDVDERVVKFNGIITSTSVDDYNRETEFRGRGRVVDVGPEAYNLPHHEAPWCKLGDYVIFDKYEGSSYKDEATDTLYRIVMDERIVAVIDEV